jgi:TM2 domain-containing membrane protein YozV
MPPPAVPFAAMTYFYLSNGQRYGPVAESELRALVAQGRVAVTDLVWREGMAAWAPAHEALGIAMPPPPPPAYAAPAQTVLAPPPPPAAASPAGQKDRVAFILLGVFLGTLGIHNFFAGYTGRGVAQLLITLLVGWLIVPWIAVAIWNIVEVITVTKDAHGLPFR